MSKRLLRYRYKMFAILVVLLFLLVPVILPSFLVSVVITVFIYASLALGWNVIMGYAGQLSLAQTLFIGAGAYTPALLFIHLRISPWLGMWAGAIIAVALGAFIGYLCFRYKVKGVYFALVSIAFSQIGFAFVTSFKVLGGGFELYWPTTNAAIDFQFTTNTPYYYIGLIMLGGMLLFTAWLTKIKTGYYFLAIRENEDAAQAIGIDTMRYKIIALSLSAFLTAIAGTFWVQYLGMSIARDQMGLGILIILVLCALIGGTGTILGPLLGALFVVTISTILRWYLPLFPGMNLAIYAGLLLLSILYLPRGIAGVFGRRFAWGQESTSLEFGKEEIRIETSSGFSPPKKQSESSRLLQAERLKKAFGGLMAVNNFSLEVNSGEIVGLIGPNGAGKTTLFNLITGFIEPAEGEITFEGNQLRGMRPDQICRHGLVRTFQIVQPFLNLTVAENVMLGAFVHYAKTPLARQKAIGVLEVLGMTDKVNVLAKDLTLAEQRRLEIARALATEPKLILLDESMSGLTPTETKEAIELLRRLRESGVTFLIVEHVMSIIMTLTNRIIVMHLGEKMAEGTPEEIMQNRKVIEAYLGEETLIA